MEWGGLCGKKKLSFKVLHEMEEEKSEKDIQYISLHMCNTLMMFFRSVDSDVLTNAGTLVIDIS